MSLRIDPRARVGLSKTIIGYLECLVAGHDWVLIVGDRLRCESCNKVKKLKRDPDGTLHH